MKVSSTTMVLAAALGVAAHPSGHHGHAHVHRSLEKRLDFVIAEKPAPPPPVEVKVEAPATTSTPPPPPPPPQPTTTKAAPAPSKPQPTTASSSSSSSGSGSAGVKPFCGGKSKRASLADIAYVGNVGIPGDYGCNYMLVDSASGYQYTATFENNSGKDQKCVVWNKIGPSGGLNGFWKNNQALSFDLPAGSSKVVAADDNTQGGASCGAGSVPTTGVGQYANTWVEWDYGNSKNNNWSGADASCLVAAAAGMPITPLKVCGSDGTCSTIQAGGKGTNAYLAGMEAADGVGLNIPAGPAALKITIG